MIQKSKFASANLRLKLIPLLYFVCLFLLIPSVSIAILNAPHDASNTINCDSCHFTSSTAPAWWSTSSANIDDVPQNRVCWQAGCHDGVAIPYKKTHSSYATESNTYGEWTWECRACHNPHHQRQVYFNEYPAGLTGIITAVDAGTRTFTLSISLPDRTGDEDPINDYAGWTIVPHTPLKTINYKIASNTIDTVTVTGDIDTDRVVAGSSEFGILIGRLLKDVINTPGGPKYVKFYRSEGENSFVHNDGLAAGGQDSTPDGVCQVCHGIRTEGAGISYTRADGTGFGAGHPSDDAVNCSGCHDHATLGFGASCAGCHGNPPVDNTTLVGFTDPSSTGSITAGAHDLHANTENISCGSCHVDSVGSGATHDDGTLTVTMGFSLFAGAYLGGAYDGQTTVVYDSSDGGLTSVSSGGLKECSNLYCHGSTMAPNAGADITPVWDDPLTGACGTCHGATAAVSPILGSHTKHAGASPELELACTLCHSGTGVHVNNEANVVFSTDPRVSGASYSGTTAMLDAYGNCSNLYCHSSGKGTYQNPQWSGASIGCNGCHGTSNALGSPDYANAGPGTADANSHLTHVTASADCNTCHTDTTTTGTAIKLGSTLHTNTLLDVTFDTSIAGSGATWTGGVGNKTCSNVYCHSNGLGTYTTPQWGDTSTGCDFCHASLPTSGAHGNHVTTAATTYGLTSVDTTGGVYDFGCGNCHPIDTANHQNGSLDITLNNTHVGPLKSLNNVADDTSGYSQTSGTSVTCSASYCHSKGDGTFTITSPDWYVAFTGDTCAHCHTNSPDTGSHIVHVVGIHYDNVYDTDGIGLVQDAYGNTNAHGDATTSTTINCNICHYNTVEIASNDQNTVCATCHGAAVPAQGNAAIKALSTFHVNGTVNVAFDTVNPMRSKAQIRDDITTVPELNTYWTRNNGYKLGATSHDSSSLNSASYDNVSGSCSTVSCHNGFSVTWGDTTVSCNSCHTELP